MHRTLSASAYVLLSVMCLLCAEALSAQEISISPRSPNSPPDAPSTLRKITEPETVLHFTSKRLSLRYGQPQFSGTFSGSRPNMEPPLEQDGRTGKEPDLRTPLDALSPQMFAPSYELIDRHTAQSPDELENYMRRIPWAGPMILRISQEPHITRVFRVLQPQF